MKSLRERAQAAAKKAEGERAKDTKPSLPLAQYAGAYKDGMYGEATVTETNGKLSLRYSPAFTGELEHWHYDNFRVKWANPIVTESLVTFTLNAQGKVDEIKVPEIADFKRVPESAATVDGKTPARKRPAGMLFFNERGEGVVVQMRRFFQG